MGSELGIPRPARHLLCVWDMRTEGGEDPRPLLVRDRVAAVVAPGERRNVVAGDAPDTLDQAVKVEAGAGRLEYQGPGMIWMP